MNWWWALRIVWRLGPSIMLGSWLSISVSSTCIDVLVRRPPSFCSRAMASGPHRQVSSRWNTRSRNASP